MTSYPVDSTDAREQREAEQARLEQAAADRREHDERCRGGWLGDDAEGRPIPCPVHRPHLIHVACWTCGSPYQACATQQAARRGACCPDCHHSRRTRPTKQTDPTSNPEESTMTTAPATPAPSRVRFTGSDLSTIHGATGPLGAALRTLPGWVAAHDKLEHLEQLGTAPVRPPAPAAEVIAAMLEEAVERREQLDVTDVVAAIRRQADEYEAAQQVHTAITTLRANLINTLDIEARSNVGTIYGALSAELVRIIDEARAYRAVIGKTAEAAIRAGAADEYAHLETLRGEYVSARHDFARLAHRLGWSTSGSHSYAELRWLSNPADAWEGWLAWQAAKTSTDPTARRTSAPPWSDPDSDRNGVPDDDHQFDWLVRTPAAIPWAPSPSTAGRAAAALAQQVREHADTKPRARKSAASQRIA